LSISFILEENAARNERKRKVEARSFDRLV
jgi:hypothetical protein